MDLTVIVPIYNMAGGGKLNYCLDSLLSQRRITGGPLEDYEILAVDDCSTDTSFQILQEYAARYPDRLTALRTPRNLHQGGAKNLALRYARGAWLAFIDADDWVSPFYFDTLLAKAAKTGADCVGCDYSLVTEHTMQPGKVVHNSRPEQAGILDDSSQDSSSASNNQNYNNTSASNDRSVYRRGVILSDKAAEKVWTLRSNQALNSADITNHSTSSHDGALDPLSRRRSLMVDFGSLCVKIYRRDIILGCPSRFPEGMFYEDNAIARTWISRMHHFEYIPEALYFYYQHEDSTVHTVTQARLEDRMKAGRMMLEEARRYGYYETFLPELEYSFTVLFYKNTLFSAMRGWKGAGCRRFVTDLAKEMKATFPDFQQNPYYAERTDPEEKKYMAIQMRQPLRFYLQYKALWAWRDFRAH